LAILRFLLQALPNPSSRRYRPEQQDGIQENQRLFGKLIDERLAVQSSLLESMKRLAEGVKK